MRDAFGGRAPVTPDDDAFLERVARPLRAPERLGDTFAERVMAGVQVAARETMPASVTVAPCLPRRGMANGGGWWSRPRTLHVSPLGALAFAAGVAGVAFIGAVTLRSVSGEHPRSTTSVAEAPAATARPAMATDVPAPNVTRIVHDTVHVVRFVLVAPGARRVTLVGDFNAWSKEATPLVATSRPGVWSVSMRLPPGRHEYAFLVQQGDTTRWVTDPAAATAHDDFGTESSVVTVGQADSSEAGHTS